MMNFSKIAGAAAIALALGVTGFAAPAAAQGFGFQVNPPGSGFSFGFDVGRPDRFDDRRDRRNRCISQRGIDDAIEDQGFRNVRITDYGRRTTEAFGVRRGYLYEIVADTCTGRVIDTDRLRRS